MDAATITEVACAIWQTGAATASLIAAWRIADSQRKRADQVALRQQIAYFDTVSGVLGEVLTATDKAVAEAKAFRRQSFTPRDALSAWATTVDGAAEAIKGQWSNAPSNAALVILVGKVLIHLDKQTDWEVWTAADAPDALKFWRRPIDDSLGEIARERRFWPLLQREAGGSLLERLKYRWWRLTNAGDNP